VSRSDPGAAAAAAARSLNLRTGQTTTAFKSFLIQQSDTETHKIIAFYGELYELHAKPFVKMKLGQ